MSESSSSHFMGSSQWAFKHSLACHECFSEHGHFPLAQTTESVMIGQALSKFELWMMKALN